MTRVGVENPFAVHEGAAETWAFIERKVLESGLVDRPLKELCFAYVADPDATNLERHAEFAEPELVELGCAIGFELGRQHFLRSLGANPAAVRASQLR